MARRPKTVRMIIMIIDQVK